MIEYLPKRLMTLAYTSSIALMMGYALWLYAMGDYRDLLIPTFMTLLLMAALLMHIGQGVKSYLPRIILLCSTYSVVLGAFYFQPQVSPLWLGLPITAAFLLLPLWAAMLINIAIGPLWWLLPSVASAPPAIIVGYAALTLLLALPRWEHARRRALKSYRPQRQRLRSFPYGHAKRAFTQRVPARCHAQSATGSAGTAFTAVGYGSRAVWPSCANGAAGSAMR